MASIAVLTGYLTVEYIWPMLKRRFFTTSILQKKLRLAKPISLTVHEEALAYGIVAPSEIGVTFADIGGMEKVIEQLDHNVRTFKAAAKYNGHDGNCMETSLVKENKFIKSKLYHAPTGILLYGPPGCGKTLIAKALAYESGYRFLNLSLAVLLDKWVGETEKYIEALFSLAHKLRPIVIFIDEIDALTRKRSSGDRDWSASMKSQFLSLWDGLMMANEGADARVGDIVILGATNRRQDIDEAFLRRMPVQVHIGLPSVVQRIQILKVLLSDVELADTFDFEQLAILTEGYSGSDLNEICRRVVLDASLTYPQGSLTNQAFQKVVRLFDLERGVGESFFLASLD